MEKTVRESLEIITAVLDLLNINLEELDKRVIKLEADKRVIKLEADKAEEEYITIRIPKNASNLDVLRKVFGCRIIHNNKSYAHINIDDDTVFRMDWLKTRYGGC